MSKIIKALFKFKSIVRIGFLKVRYRRKFLGLNIFSSSIQGDVTVVNCGQVIVGRKFQVRRYAHINCNGGNLYVGHRVFINRNSSLNCQLEISIGNDCLFGENVVIYDHDHDFSDPYQTFNKQGFIRKPVRIGNNVWVGSNSTILKGVSVGDNVVIAAGSVVINDIPDNSIYVQKRKSSFFNIRH